MRYRFDYQITALDLWQLSMYGIYGSMIGVCNIIFTIAILLLAVKFWSDVNNFIKILLIAGICLFPVIQPASIYVRAKRQVAGIPRGFEISFDDKGIHLKAEKQNSELKWKMIRGISKKPNMIVIYTTNNFGYILTNKVLGEQKEDFYRYLVSKINRK